MNNKMTTQAVITVEFNELSKSVTARTKIELQGEYNQELVDEAYNKGKELFEKAFANSKSKTLEK